MSKSNFLAILALAFVSLLFAGTGYAGGKVQVGNEAGLVPFCKSNTSDFAASAAGTGAIFTVPGGKRLVIETISLKATVASGANFTASLNTRTGGQLAVTQIVMTPQGPQGSLDKFASTLPVRLYADGGTNVDLNTLRSTTSTAGKLNWSVSGYLVSMP